MLHLVIPAIETLHRAWLQQQSKCSPQFTDALNAGINKVAQYYNQTEESDTYLVAMGA
jgi:hypothetical protein